MKVTPPVFRGFQNLSAEARQIGAMSRRILGALLLCQAVAWADQSSVSIAGLEPTVLFPDKEPLQQVGWLQVVNSGTANVTCTATVKVDGKVQGEGQELNLPAGSSTQDVLIPEIKKAAEVEVELKSADGTTLAGHKQAWQPQRKWIVYVIKSSHEDLGYETFIFEKQASIAHNIDLARKVNGEKETPPDAAGKQSSRGYHYTLETLVFQRNYIDERSEAAWRSVVEKDIKTGKMDLMGAPSGIHPQWMDYEELARATYPARRETKDRFGLDLKTFLLVDNPSVSWSAAQVLADAGFKYIMRLGQPWRTGGNNNYESTKLPAIFWWEGPDGQSKILYSWRPFYAENFWFGEPDGGGADLSDLAKINVNRELQKVQSGQLLGPYPYDAMIVASYEDHELPKWDNRALKRWQSQYRYPEIRIAGITDFFEYMERKYAKEIPTERGELNNFSGDYAAIDPASQGWKRRASRLLPLAEGTAALAGLLDPSYQPPLADTERAYTRLFDFVEHSWPTSPPPVDYQVFNAQWVKHQEGRRALDAAQALTDSSFSALFKHIPTGDKPEVVVFNPLAHTRTDLALIDGDHAGLVDAVTGQPVVTQKVEDNKTLFVAKDMPAYGYKTFLPGAAAASPTSTLESGEDFIGNEFYTIRFDRKSGAITSIFDKQLKREVVDAEAKQQFNQMIWVRKNSRDGKQGKNIALTEGATLTPQAGPIRVEMVAKINDPQTGGAVEQKVALYAGLKRIDVINNLTHVRAMHAAERSHRYRENIFYAFPVAVKDFTQRVEYPGGVVRPYDDQLRWGSHDFLNANWWVDVSNKDYGVTMAPWNATTVSFGDIRYNELSVDYKPEKPWLYSYAWSNRMSGLIELHPDEWNAVLGYSFTTHEGDWDTGKVTQFGWSIGSPLETRLLPAGQKGELPAKEKSFLSISAPNVQLTTLKQSLQPGRGWVARFVETDGKPARVTVDLSHFPIKGAALCDLVENDVKVLTVKDGKVTFDLGPFAFATLRFNGPETALPKVADLKGETVSDKSVRLTWAPVPKGAAYLIYRSEDPASPATAYSLIGRSTQPEFTDDWLKIGTDYFYYVAPVSTFNQQGENSAQVAVRTDTKNVSAPRELTGLGIIRQGPRELKVYWDKSPEPDVARYLVYRSGDAGLPFEQWQNVATVPANTRFLQTWLDTTVSPASTYFYKVLPEDWSGNRQAASPVTSASTPPEQKIEQVKKDEN